MSDVIDVARGTRLSTFGVPASALGEVRLARSATPAPYYLRMELMDRPGALAKIATVLGEAGISIDRMRQYRHEADTAPVLIVTHACARDALDAALAAMPATGVVATEPVALRIESV